MINEAVGNCSAKNQRELFARNLPAAVMVKSVVIWWVSFKEVYEKVLRVCMRPISHTLLNSDVKPSKWFLKNAGCIQEKMGATIRQRFCFVLDSCIEQGVALDGLIGFFQLHCSMIGNVTPMISHCWLWVGLMGVVSQNTGFHRTIVNTGFHRTIVATT